jgi:hypothetical protein
MEASRTAGGNFWIFQEYYSPWQTPLKLKII